MIHKSKILKKLRNVGLFLFILSFGFLALAHFSQAQGIDAGINVVNNAIYLSADDPRIMAARIIQIFLSLLGIITVILIIYAGALWMLSEGNEEKISQAKSILKQTVIGLAIILASWAITTFILNKLIGQTNNAPSSEPSNTRQNNLDLGLAALGNCTLESVYPTPGQVDVARNTSILVTFKEPINLSTVCTPDSNGACVMNTSTIKIYQKDDETPVEAKVSSTPDGKTLVITPDIYLGSESKNTHYFARLDNGIKKKDVNESIFKTCTPDYFVWEFTVSNKLDLTPPKIVGIFPGPDNDKDTYTVSTAARAKGIIFMSTTTQPTTYKAASILSIDRATSSMPAIADRPPAKIENYHGQDTNFSVTMGQDLVTHGLKAQLFSGLTSLGAADFVGLKVVFRNYFSFTVDTTPAVGNQWNIVVSPEILATTLTIGSKTYAFADNNEGNNIKVEDTPLHSFDSIINKIKEDKDNADIDNLPFRVVTPRKFQVEAKIAGTSGNNIVLGTNNSEIFTLVQHTLTEGTDGGSNITIHDKKDQPRNSVIQINFDEAINPLAISGSSLDLKNYLQVFIANGKTDNTSCTKNDECKSNKCINSLCVGDYLSGNFIPSSNFKTVEFVSNNECGMNGCGEKIYCLPAESKLQVAINAADLLTCTGDKDCARFGAFKCTANSALGHLTCQNTGKNFPASDFNSLNPKYGLSDLANNSLDGNGDGYADGPRTATSTDGTRTSLAYHANKVVDSSLGDNFTWTFFINNQLLLDSPFILPSLVPSSGQSTFGIDKQIIIPFSTLMMASSIKTGSETKTINLGSGDQTVVHKLLNLWSKTPQPIGFWTGFNNKDAVTTSSPLLDLQPDVTDVYINHSSFADSVTYNAQAGSGLKDIYQNCFKPSSGPECSATDELASCCFGTPTSSSLGLANGNCK